MALITVGAQEFVPDRPFTDLTHTSLDFQVMRFMAACICLYTDKIELFSNCENQSSIFHFPSLDRWTYRIVITQCQKLLNLNPLTVVGFFGLRDVNADLALAQSLDRGLIPELSQFDSLLAYVSVNLPTGNFGNLVIFTSPQGKDEWGRSEKHNEAVRILTPDFYTAVRLYNGELPDGIRQPETMRLDLVKYYDYRINPIWRAVRPLSKEA